MNVNIVRLGPVTAAIRDLCKQVTRLADAYEMDLADRGLHVKAPKADTSGPEPDVLYTNEEIDALMELAESEGKMTESLRRMYEEGRDLPQGSD